jgi:hypothetical protein
MHRFLPQERPHPNIVESTETSPAREGHGGNSAPVPVSVTAPLTPEMRGFSTHAAQSADSGSLQNPHAQPHGNHHHGAQANTAADAAMDRARLESMSVDDLLQEIWDHDLLHFGLRNANDEIDAASGQHDGQHRTDSGPTSVEPAQANDSLQHAKAGTSTDVTSQEAFPRISLAHLRTKQNPAVKGGDEVFLDSRVPTLRFDKQKLELPVHYGQTFSRDVPLLGPNRDYVAELVKAILKASEYKVRYTGDAKSPVLHVVDAAGKTAYRVFVGVCSQNRVRVPSGDYLRGYDVLAQVLIDRDDFPRLKQLYLIPLKP